MFQAPICSKLLAANNQICLHSDHFNACPFSPFTHQPYFYSWSKSDQIKELTDETFQQMQAVHLVFILPLISAWIESKQKCCRFSFFLSMGKQNMQMDSPYFFRGFLSSGANMHDCCCFFLLLFLVGIKNECEQILAKRTKNTCDHNSC